MIDLHLGDSLEYIKKLPDKGIDLIVTDPPYDFENGGEGGIMKRSKSIKAAFDTIKATGIDNGYDYLAFNTEFCRIMRSINIYIFCNKLQIPWYLDFYVTQRKCKFDILIWNKPNAMPLYGRKYLSDCEYLLYFRKGGLCDPKSYEDAKTVYYAPINQEDKKYYYHPTIKPLPLIMKIIRNSSVENDIILDPFMGSGTTGVACKALNRKFIGCEIDTGFFETAKSRIYQTMESW